MIIEEIILNKEIKGFGNTAHVTISKRHIGKRVHVLILPKSMTTISNDKIAAAIEKIEKKLAEIQKEKDTKFQRNNTITEVKGIDKHGKLILGKTKPMAERRPK